MTATSADPTTLRAALLEHCRLAGWTPQQLGQTGQEPGLQEALLEIIATRDAEATQLSLELISLCEAQGWSSPWLLDNRARCLVHQGRDSEAVAIWEQLSRHHDAAVAGTARSTLAALEARPVAAVRANQIRQLRERNEPERWQPLLLEALLNSNGSLPPELASLLEELAAEQAPPPNGPWDADLLKQELLLQLYEHQLPRWEAALA